MADTVTVRYEGGSISEVDVPEVGTVQRELFDDHVAAGRYVIIDGEVGDAAVEELDDEYPDGGTIADVLGWVGDDADRAAEALEMETAKDEPRKGLVEALSKGDA